MYTIKQGNKTVSLTHKEKHYIIGFESVVHARKVQYSMHPMPEMVLLRNNNIDVRPSLNAIGLKNTSLVLDIGATLFIPKHKGDPLHPINDGCFHLGFEKYNEFITYPLTKSLGIVMPYELKDEDEHEFMFRSHVIEPTFNSLLFG